MPSTFHLLAMEDFSDYELLDSGEGEKLERFGKFILRRPEPQAIWKRNLSVEEWTKQANASFTRKSANINEESGNWSLAKGMPDRWQIAYQYKELSLKLRLALTSFKHVGVFPEQSQNWNYLYDAIKNMPVEQPAALNLFAYTGAASLVMRSAGADVVHVDSVKPVITWANENRVASGIGEIRWLVEDAMKFVKREVRREKKYQVILLDPPAYGRGPDGEKWLLERDIDLMIEACAKLLDPVNGVFVINLYSLGLSALVVENLIRQYFPDMDNYEFGELFIPEKQGRKLPLGTFLRFNRASK
jgi:23S rRNA (cytosine1962-C5)-methyltransferase